MIEKDLGSELIAPELAGYVDMLKVCCERLESAYSTVSLIAQRAVELSENSAWCYAIAKDLFMACSNIQQAVETIGINMNIINQPEVREIVFDDDEVKA